MSACSADRHEWPAVAVTSDMVPHQKGAVSEYSCKEGAHAALADL